MTEPTKSTAQIAYEAWNIAYEVRPSEIGDYENTTDCNKRAWEAAVAAVREEDAKTNENLQRKLAEESDVIGKKQARISELTAERDALRKRVEELTRSLGDKIREDEEYLDSRDNPITMESTKGCNMKTKPEDWLDRPNKDGNWWYFDTDSDVDEVQVCLVWADLQRVRFIADEESLRLSEVNGKWYPADKPEIPPSLMINGGLFLFLGGQFHGRLLAVEKKLSDLRFRNEQPHITSLRHPQMEQYVNYQWRTIGEGDNIAEVYALAGINSLDLQGYFFDACIRLVKSNAFATVPQSK